jgi:hypothetical protein
MSITMERMKRVEGKVLTQKKGKKKGVTDDYEMEKVKRMENECVGKKGKG